MDEQHELFPNIFEAALLIALLVVIELVAWAAVVDAGLFAQINASDVSAFIVVVGNGVLFVGLMAYKRIGYGSLFHSARHSVSATLTIVTLPILMMVPGLVVLAGVLSVFVDLLFPLSAEDASTFEEMMSTGLVPFISTCVLAPVLEEMLFRGVILRSFLRQYSRTKAILASSLIFGIAHMNVYQLATAFAIGIVAGWLYERCRSLWPCILLHAAYNGFVTWSYQAALAGSTETSGFVTMYTGAAFAGVIIGALLLMRVLGSGQAASTRE